MTLATFLSIFSLPDWMALLGLVLGWAVIGWVIEHPPASRPSVTVLMADMRREWMRVFVTRVPRIFDATVMDSLRQGTAFFASACMLALGGGLALIGNTDRLAGVAAGFTLDTSTRTLELKLIVVMLFLANAFLKFVWANRLFGYCAILMAAVPNEPEDPAAFPRAAQAAEINITAARSFNRGLQSVYFAMAALAWLLGHWALVLATLATCAMMLRREFASNSRRMLAEGHDARTRP